MGEGMNINVSELVANYLKVTPEEQKAIRKDPTIQLGSKSLRFLLAAGQPLPAQINRALDENTITSWAKGAVQVGMVVVVAKSAWDFGCWIYDKVFGL